MFEMKPTRLVPFILAYFIVYFCYIFKSSLSNVNHRVYISLMSAITQNL